MCLAWAQAATVGVLQKRFTHATHYSTLQSIAMSLLCTFPAVQYHRAMKKSNLAARHSPTVPLGLRLSMSESDACPYQYLPAPATSGLSNCECKGGCQWDPRQIPLEEEWSNS